MQNNFLQQLLCPECIRPGFEEDLLLDIPPEVRGVSRSHVRRSRLLRMGSDGDRSKQVRE